MASASDVRAYAPSPARRTEVHRQLEARAGLSEGAAMLLVELDVFGEVRLVRDEDLPALAELRARGLAELSEAPRACLHAVPTSFVRTVLESVRSILALEAELATRAERTASATTSSTQARSASMTRPSPSEPLPPELERALIVDALALVDRTPTLPAASQVRVYLRVGPKFVRVFWTYAAIDDGSGSILHFVERATGRVYRAKSARQVGAPTARVIAGFPARLTEEEADDA